MSHFVICKFYLIIIETSLFDFFFPSVHNKFVPRGHVLISPTEGEADHTLHGPGPPDKGSTQSGYFSTIPFTPQVHQIPGSTSLTPSLPGDKYFRRRNQQI